jgi:hypothetical protein
MPRASVMRWAVPRASVTRLGTSSAGLIRYALCVMSASWSLALRRDTPRCNDPTDQNLRQAAVYDPIHGLGIRSEWDANNEAGSCLILAMVLPERFGVPGAPALMIFGKDPPVSVISISDMPATSSRGPDMSGSVFGRVNPPRNATAACQANPLDRISNCCCCVGGGYPSAAR